MVDALFADIAEFQVPVDDSYPRRVLSIRVCGGNAELVDHQNRASSYRSWLDLNSAARPRCRCQGTLRPAVRRGVYREQIQQLLVKMHQLPVNLTLKSAAANTTCAPIGSCRLPSRPKDPYPLDEPIDGPSSPRPCCCSCAESAGRHWCQRSPAR